MTLFSGAATRTYLNVRQSATLATSLTASVNTGSAGLLVIVVAADITINNGSITSVTVAGNSATIHAQNRGNSTFNNNSVITGVASINSSGGTQSIVVTMDGAFGNYNVIGFDCYVLSGLISTTPTATSTQGTATDSTSISANLSVPSNGIAIASIMQAFNSTLSTTTLSFDQNATLNAHGWAVASDQNLSAQTLTIVNTNATANSIQRSISAVAWN